MVLKIEKDMNAGRLKLIADALCLDFTNTVYWRASDHSYDWLRKWSDLVSWSAHARILTESEAETLLRDAEKRPSEASSILKRATALREAIYRIFSEISNKHQPKTGDLSTLSRELLEAQKHLQIMQEDGHFVLGWATDERSMDRVLWQIAKSAVELLTSNLLGRVRQCKGEDCGWLFLDMSKNRSRRWCTMEDCGNRAKAHRHYQRKRVVNRQAS